MRKPLITEHMLQAAFDYLNEHGEDAALAKADLVLAEHRRKKIRAQLILDSEEKTMGMKEAEAECHPDYETAFVVEARATERVEWHKHQKARAEAILDAWRTMESTARSLGRVV